MLIRVSSWDIVEINAGQELSPEKVKTIPASARRRLNKFGKVAGSLVSDKLDDAPLIVFASRYGDIERSLRILEEISQNEVLSPMNFSLSVHNAVPGVLSIAWNLTQMQSVISASENTFAMGLTEAFSLLKSFPQKSVLLVYVDLPLPSIFSEFHAGEGEIGAGALLMSGDCSSKEGVVFQAQLKTGTRENSGAAEKPLHDLSLMLDGNKKSAVIGTKTLAWTLEKQDG